MRRLGPAWAAAATVALALPALLGSCRPRQEPLVVFYAPAFEPVFRAHRARLEAELGRTILTETAGSQTLLRKVSELGRSCDLVLLADSHLFGQVASSHFDWRLDFASDEMVLAVGARAPMADRAERDWPAVLADDAVRLGRADESLGPIGYRTLLVWELEAQRGHPGLRERLGARASPVVSDAGKLAALLKAGEVDYAFLYRTTCLMHDIRFIALDPAINLGVAGRDYSAASVSFTSMQGGAEKTIVVRGAPILYGLSIPTNAAHPDEGARLAALLLSEPGPWREAGFSWFSPVYYGSASDYARFSRIARHAGAMP